MKKLTPILIIIACIILLSYVTYDICVNQPKLYKKVEYVTKKFNSYKIYLDTKLPELDSIVLEHSKQISFQNDQLIELNELTTILKEE